MVDEGATYSDPTTPRRGFALTERQRVVLRAVVEDHVRTAMPVGSKGLVDRFGLNVFLLFLAVGGGAVALFALARIAFGGAA